MAAVSTVFLALLKQGDHVVGTHPLYGPSRGLLEKYFSRLGVTSTFVAAADSTALAAAIRPETKMVYVETPANPNLDLVDLAAAAGAAHQAGVPLVVDNTFAGPHLQRPIPAPRGSAQDTLARWVSRQISPRSVSSFSSISVRRRWTLGCSETDCAHSRTVRRATAETESCSAPQADRSALYSSSDSRNVTTRFLFG